MFCNKRILNLSTALALVGAAFISQANAQENLLGIEEPAVEKAPVKQENTLTAPSASQKEIMAAAALAAKKTDQESKVEIAEEKKPELITPPVKAMPKITKQVEPEEPMEEEDALDVSEDALDAIVSRSDLTDSSLFEQMSDLERQTTLLTLELRREKIKNDIEAMKNQRKMALEEEKDRLEQKQKAKEKEAMEREQKILQEQQKLQELNIALEKLRQEKVLATYKEKMLADKQLWLDKYAEMHAQRLKEKEDQKTLNESIKSKFVFLSDLAKKTEDAVKKAAEEKQAKIEELQTQVSVLQARLDAETKVNPFAEQEEDDKELTKKKIIAGLQDTYTITEVQGVGEQLTAKIVNKNGKSFNVKKGTVLQTGHTVTEITNKFVCAEKAGKKEFIYFAGVGVLDFEPMSKEDEENDNEELVEESVATEETAGKPVMASSIPGMASEMMAE